MGSGVRDDEVGRAKRVTVDPLEHACGERALTEPAAVADERVGKRNERIEDHRTATCGSSCRRQVEVARVPDDERVEAVGTAGEQSGLGCRKTERTRRPCAPAVTDAIPDRNVLFVHLDAGSAEA